MVLKSKLAVMKDVPIMYRLEEFVLDMEQKLRLAVMKDVPTNHEEKKEYV